MKLIPEQRKSLGLTLLISGLVAIVMSGIIMFMLSSARTEAAERFTESRNSCKTKLAALGGEVSDPGGRIVWMKNDLSEAPARLGEASVAAVMCPGWKLQSACMGERCPDNNSMRIVLSPITSENE